MALIHSQLVRDPAAFLGQTAVAFDYAGAVSGVNQWVVEDHQIDGVAPIVRLKKAADASGFAAYFLPYADNQTYQLTLGSAADIMFTPPLTGCSFFIDKKWWDPTVSHINQQTGLGGIDQMAIDTSAQGVYGSQQWTGLRLVANYHGVRKYDYTPSGESPQNHRLYVVGVRGSLGWYLYRMKHDPATCTVVEAPSRIN